MVVARPATQSSEHGILVRRTVDAACLWAPHTSHPLIGARPHRDLQSAVIHSNPADDRITRARAGANAPRRSLNFCKAARCREPTPTRSRCNQPEIWVTAQGVSAGIDMALFLSTLRLRSWCSNTHRIRPFNRALTSPQTERPFVSPKAFSQRRRLTIRRSATCFAMTGPSYDSHGD